MGIIRTFAITLFFSVAVGWTATAKNSQPKKSAVKVKATPESTLNYLFTTKPAPKNFSDLQDLCFGICGWENNKAKKSGIVIFNRKKKGIFKIYSSTGKGEPDKMVVDWNCNKDYSDEIVMSAPSKKASSHTVMLNGSKRDITIVNIKKNGNFIFIRTGNWHYGRLKLNGKMYQVAIIDVDMNGINSSGYDILVIDLNGDGIFSFHGKKLEGEVALRSKMMIFNETFNVAFDSVSKTLSMANCSNLGIVAITIPPDWIDPVMSIKVYDKKKKQVFTSLKFKDNVFKIPPGHYSSVKIKLTFKKGKDEYGISMFNKEFIVKANETTALTLQVPSGLDPQVRIVKRAINIKEGFSFEKLTKGIMPKSRFSYNKKQMIAPKITIFNGTVIINQGSMEYG